MSGAASTAGSVILPEFQGFFAHAQAGRLAFPRCRACERFHWYPMPVCPHCRGHDIDWAPIAGNGRILTYTVVRHGFDATRRERLPYVVAIVTFDDAPGVQLVTNIIDAAPEALAIGHAVTPVFPPPGSGEAPVLFRLTAAGQDTPP